MSKHTLSPHGLDLLKRYEAFKADAYLCPAGKPTIGYGHVIKTHERFLRPLGETEAEALLRGDYCYAETCINAVAAGKGSLNGSFALTQYQFDALVLLVFNIGTANFMSSTLLRYLQDGRKAEAAAQFLVWNKITVNGKRQTCTGLVNRRQAEMQLFLGFGLNHD